MPRLADILGQDQALTVLRRAISARKLAQAYLFSGPAGVGKVTTAVALAAALSCEQTPGEGCDDCPSCSKIARGLHPDLLLVAPDGAQIKIDQVRALEQHLGYPPHEGRYRVIVLDGADQLNIHAANALLKSVEEPRPSTLFVLVSSATHRLAPTLVSRCQRIRFAPIDAAAVLSILEREGVGDEAQQREAAALSGGSAQRALRLLEGEHLGLIQRMTAALLQAAGSSSVLPLFEAAADAGKDRLELVEVLDYLRVWLRDLLLVREGLEQGRVLNADHLQRLRDEAQLLDRHAILRRLRAVDEAQAALRGNVQPALALENLGLRMRQVSIS
jgi:DNA polymerase III subunit delta'